MQPTKDFDRYKFLKKPIIKPKKLTFNEWINQIIFTGNTRKEEFRKSNIDIIWLEKVWDTAQENK